ncbi:unnamed protein product [Cercopithifilaria johnstoni]|uniref:MH2 domain-containing protein n=1 Tax=Cercopithifilaria johnstoni TaxID=2874296 RepID=A0A8J2PZI1_9BILA|nr:unnamed protein product [Cercopithifilaria johnstoni]
MRDECSLSRKEIACMAGVGRGPNGVGELQVLLSNNSTSSADRWYTVEQFEKEHVIEILEKLEKGHLDDDLWGKIILMEKCRRLVKIYLRKATLIIDGSNDEYDGITLGFNHFENFDHDKDSNDIRDKIGDGVIIKIDENGNIKAMARGLAPVIVQGWNDPTSKCIPKQLIAQKGRLKTIKDRLKGITDQQRVEKIFDMRLFNWSIEQELKQSKPNTLKLLLKSCIRISLVKDVGMSALKTPCWFMIVNLVALDVLRSKLPILSLITGTQHFSSQNNNVVFSTPSATQSNVTLNEIFPSYRRQMSMDNSGKRFESLPAPDGNRQLMKLADIQQEKPSVSQNLISLQQWNWRKNSSKFLNKDEILEDEETDDTASSEHKLTKSMEEVEASAPKACDPCGQRRHLTSDLLVNTSNREAENISNNDRDQNIQCIRISDNDDCVKQELSQESGKYFQIARTTKHSGLVTDKEYLDPYFIYSRNDSSKVFMNNRDNSCDAKKYQNKQCITVLKNLTTGNERSRNQNQPFAELPKVNYIREKVETSANMMSIHHSIHENIKKADDILNMDPEKVQSFHKETCSISQHPYVLKINNDKTNHSKNTFISSGKLLRNVGGNLTSKRDSHKSTGNLAYSKKPGWKIEEAKLRKQCVQHRLKPITHLVPIIRKNSQEPMILPQKKIALRRFIGKEPNQQHASNIFMNPIYVDAERNMTVFNGYSQQPKVIAPQWETPPPLYGERQNLNIDILYKHSTIVPSYSPYSGNRYQSRKALRRFI